MTEGDGWDGRERTTGTSGGVHATLRFEEPACCPIALASGDADCDLYDVRRSLGSPEDDRVTEAFAVESNDLPTFDAEDLPSHGGAERLFGYADRSIYRFDRPRDLGCICDTAEALGCVVTDVRASEGDLRLTLLAGGAEEVAGAVEGLEERFGDVTVLQVTGVTSRSDGDLVLLDAGRLTERQMEVLRTAYEMGYFDHPKRANAGEVADRLGVARSTVSQHLAAAQTKLLGDLMGQSSEERGTAGARKKRE